MEADVRNTSMAVPVCPWINVGVQSFRVATLFLQARSKEHSLLILLVRLPHARWCPLTSPKIIIELGILSRTSSWFFRSDFYSVRKANGNNRHGKGPGESDRDNWKFGIEINRLGCDVCRHALIPIGRCIFFQGCCTSSQERCDVFLGWLRQPVESYRL